MEFTFSIDQTCIKTTAPRDNKGVSNKQEGYFMAKNYNNMNNNSNKNSGKNSYSSYADEQRNKNAGKNSSTSNASDPRSKNSGKNMESDDMTDRY